MRYMSSSQSAAGRPKRAQTGFSLVEVLVSIVVLSFGLLGMVGLQAAALKYNRDAKNQSVAVSLARELAEMMRANAQVAAKTTGNPYYGTFTGNPLQPATTESCLNVGSNCTDTTKVANAQMTDWLSRVEQALPGAQVKVCADVAPYNTSGIPVWACTAPTGGSVISVIKIGWKREQFNNSDISAAQDKAPYVVFPVTPSGQS